MGQIDAQASQNGTDAESEASGSFSTYGGDAGAEAETTDQSAEVTELSPDDGVVFLADLARAMQATAAAEQARIAEATERRRALHVGGIRAREAAEADEIRELADDDVKGINAWADGEIKRLKLERERRITARREQLQIRLEEHRAVVAREVEAVETAVATYRAQVDHFFGGLETETDPVVIASQAGNRPVFPDLDQIRPEDASSVLVAPVTSSEMPIGEAPSGTEMAVHEGFDAGGVADGGEDADQGDAASEAETNDPAQAESDAVPVAVMDPEAIAQSESGMRWDAATDAEAEPAAAAVDAPAAEGAAQGDHASTEEPVVVAETAVLPRSSGAGSWLRWPNGNNNSDRFGPGR
jgi:hypothetical protein